jgi:hypothetical protein
MTSSGNAAFDFLVRGGGIISKETSGGIESGALPILDWHLADEMNVRREVGLRRNGKVIGSADNISVLGRQRHRALGNMVLDWSFTRRMSDGFGDERFWLA